MKLRITSGSLRGRVITIPPKLEDFRPTLERYRQAIAESIKLSIVDAHVVDICAGSGAFGFEMLSRGARQVDFVEEHRGRSKHIEHHAELFGAQHSCTVFGTSVATFVQRSRTLYDIIYFDPPYEDSTLAQLTPQLFTLLAPKGILLYEHNRKTPTPEPTHGVVLNRSKAIGAGVVDIYQRPLQTSDV